MANLSYMSIEAVIFDVGGVLVESPFVAAMRWAKDWDLPESALATLFGEYSRVPVLGQEPPIWHEVECGRVPLTSFIENMKRNLARDLPKNHRALRMEASDFNPFRGAELNQDVLGLVHRLRDQGLRVSILTNNVVEWSEWRSVVPIENFEDVVDSCEVGIRKPDPEIFQLACRRLLLPADSCLFLDDHPGNVDAARTFGLHAVLVADDYEALVREVLAMV
ncbi:MAG: HAD family phosphatase [Actinomycetota bacterium]|nr:HAD family phosphatase [Actinomycetota bacterium]MDG1488747.1 HAD family phosphatase [Actinomycetota bacterium]